MRIDSRGIDKLNAENLGYGFRKVLESFYSFCKGVFKKIDKI